MEFLFTLLILLLCAKVFGELLHHFGFSVLIGEVAVGIVLGPSVLGWIKPDAYIEAVAMLGLVVLMLVAGMNSRFDLFMKIKFQALVIAILGVVASFVLGFGVVYAWIQELLPSLFVAAALSNTATEIVARVTEGSRFGPLTIGAALIDDILAVYILGILSAATIRGGIDLDVFSWATVGVVAFFLAVGYLSHKLVVEKDVMRKLWRFERRGIPLTFALILALLLAVIAQRVGLHAIIGAYMAGLFVGRLRERPDALLLSRIRLNAILDDATTSLQAILTPMFFVHVGLIFAPDWSQIKLVMLLALVAAAFAGKIIGCGAGAAAMGYKPRDSVAIGTAMCSRGSLELAVLQFGFLSLKDYGFTPELFAAMVVTTLITTILTPVLFKYVAGKQL